LPTISNVKVQKYKLQGLSYNASKIYSHKYSYNKS